MRQMKNSGIEWIGEIPEAWSCAKLSYYINIFTGNSISDGEKGRFEISDGIPYIATKDINVDYSSVDYDNGMRVPFDSTFKIAKRGSVLLCIEGGSAGKKIAFIDRNVAFVNKLCAFKARTAFIDKYLYYFIYSDAFVAPFNLSMTGLIGGVSQAAIRAIKMVVPTNNDQQKIADFLDEKCAKIDNLISHEEATIKELKAYKQSVITEVVTKGLNKSAPMKDSGVEWIGDIPSHWIADRLKNILTERNEKNDPIKTTERLSLSIDLGVTLYADKTTNLDRFKDDFTQYKIAYPNDLILNSMNMIVGAVGVSSFCGCVSPAYYVLYSKAKKDYMSKYFYYLFKTKSMNRYLYSIGRGIYAIERGDDRVNTCRLKISREDLNNLLLPIPPNDEMLRIIKKVEETEFAVDNLIRTKQQKIEELKVYKKSLIYEYVTGKKEVI